MRYFYPDVGLSENTQLEICKMHIDSWISKYLQLFWNKKFSKLILIPVISDTYTTVTYK